MNLDGSNIRKLTSAPERDGHPSFSSDGKRIAFQSARFGKDRRDVDIFVMSPIGEEVKRLTDNDAFTGVPEFSPDGKKIIYQSKTVKAGTTWEENHWNLFVMNSDGTNQRALTHGEHNYQIPSFSPDGRRILFCSDVSGNYELYAMDTAGADMHQLTKSDSADMAASWSPDGKQIAFTSNREGSSELYLMNQDGSGVKRLTNESLGNALPHWSPDGKQLLIVGRAGEFMDIFILDIETLKHHRVERQTR